MRAQLKKTKAMSKPIQEDVSNINKEEKKPKVKQQTIIIQKPAKVDKTFELVIVDDKPEDERLVCDDEGYIINIYAHAENFIDLPRLKRFTRWNMNKFYLQIIFKSGILKASCKLTGGHRDKYDQSHTFLMLDDPNLVFDPNYKFDEIKLYNQWMNPMHLNKADMNYYHDLIKDFRILVNDRIYDRREDDDNMTKYHRQTVAFSIYETDNIYKYDKYAYREDVKGKKKPYDIYVRTKKTNTDRNEEPVKVNKYDYGVSIDLFPGEGESPVDVKIGICVTNEEGYKELKKAVKSRITSLYFEIEETKKLEIEEIEDNTSTTTATVPVRSIFGNQPINMNPFAQNVIPGAPIQPIGIKSNIMQPAPGVNIIKNIVPPPSIIQSGQIKPLQFQQQNVIPQGRIVLPIQQQPIFPVINQKETSKTSTTVMEIEKVPEENKEKEIPITSEQQPIVKMVEEPNLESANDLLDFMSNLQK